ncbi:MAG: hypothetical protein WCI27_10335, partial [Candidatus Omnitrophota bacterium]
MIIKQFLCVIIIVLTTLRCAVPVNASRIDTYHYFIAEGQEAVERQDESKAIHYFKWAHRLNPSAAQPVNYLKSIPGGRAVLGNEKIYFALKSFYDARQRDPRAKSLIDHVNQVKHALDQHIMSEVQESLIPAHVPAAPVDAQTRTRTAKTSLEDVVSIADIIKENMSRPTL